MIFFRIVTKNTMSRKKRKNFHEIKFLYVFFVIKKNPISNVSRFARTITITIV